MSSNPNLRLGAAGQVNGVCPTLPSSTAAYRMIAGDEHALGSVVLSTAGRAALVGAGAWVAGVRGRQLWRAALGGAIGIEVFVLLYAWWQLRRDRAAVSASAP